MNLGLEKSIFYHTSSRKWTRSGREKSAVTGAGPLRECENTELVWEFNKTGFSLGGR